MSASRNASRTLIDLSGARSSAYVCRSCRRTLQRSFSSVQPRHQEIPFTEKIRRKIWGTDNPPGLKDPYGGPSFLERRRMERQARERAEQGEQQAPSEHEIATATPVKAPVRSAPVREVSDDYTPAETWDGLEHVGHVGEWQDMEETPAEYIDHFLSPPPTQQPPSLEDLTYAMSRAIVECSVLHGSPEASALDLPTTPDSYTRTLAETPILLDAHNKIQGINIPDDAKAQLAETLMEPSTTDTLADPEKHTPSNPSWLDARLDFTNPLTFQILSRLTLLTHTRIPDPVLTTHLNSPSSTIHSLLHAIHSRLVKKTPTKLAEKLKKSDKLAGVSNLVVFPRRESQIDKEKELGRWKIIERELRERGLPLVQGGIGVQR